MMDGGGGGAASSASSSARKRPRSSTTGGGKCICVCVRRASSSRSLLTPLPKCSLHAPVGADQQQQQSEQQQEAAADTLADLKGSVQLRYASFFPSIPPNRPQKRTHI